MGQPTVSVFDEKTAAAPGSKLRSMISDVSATARSRIPHNMGGGGGGKIDDVASFAMLALEILNTKLKEIASRRKPGGHEMWLIVRKAFSITEQDARKLCITLGYDPLTTVRDREGA